MKRMIFAIIFICPPFLKKHILRWFGRAKIGHRVHIGWFSSVMGKHIEIGDYSEVRSLTLIMCDGEVSIGAYSAISNFVLVYGAASFVMGDHSYIGPQCLINADEDVRIGNVSGLGPRCMIFTHGGWLPYTEGYWFKFGGVTVGNHVWIAAGVFIHPGVEVGDNAFVNSRSVLKQNVPAGEVVEGFPAKRVTTAEAIRRIMTPERVDAALRQILKHFAKLVLRERLEVSVKEDTANQLSFHYRGRQYHVMLIAPNVATPAGYDMEDGKRIIFLVNRQNWAPPPTVRNSMVFNVTTFKTCLSDDPIHAELLQFMRRFYGIQFEYQ